MDRESLQFLRTNRDFSIISIYLTAKFTCEARAESKQLQHNLKSTELNGVVDKSTKVLMNLVHPFSTSMTRIAPTVPGWAETPGGASCHRRNRLTFLGVSGTAKGQRIECISLLVSASRDFHNMEQTFSILREEQCTETSFCIDLCEKYEMPA